MSVTNMNGTLFSAANATCDHVGLNLARQPDADVAGAGVILAFLIPSFISVVFIVVAYWAGLINDELLTTADRQFYRVQDRVLKETTGHWARWAEGMEQGILWFSDVQLIFGVAMLITGLSQLRTISIYHIQMVTYQAWMSSNVHLVTLTALREYFRQNKVLRGIRVTGMLILAGLLAVALIPTSSLKAKQILLGRLTKAGTSYGFNAPARCFFTANEGLAGPIDPDAPWSFILLIVSYLWKISCLFETCRFAFLQYVRAASLDALERRLIALSQPASSTATTFLNRRRYKIVLIIYLALMMVFDFFASFALSLYFLLLNLAWGTVQILVPRFAFNASASYDQDENAWGFGQMLPLLLLLLPPIAIAEHFYGHSDEDRLVRKLRTPKYLPDYYADVEDDAPRLSVVSSSKSMMDLKDGLARATYTSVTPVDARIGLLSSSVTTAAASIAPSSPEDVEAEEATVQLLPSSRPGRQSRQSSLKNCDADRDPLDEHCAIGAFFARASLTKPERTRLHALFYRSRTFRLGLWVLNLGTVAVLGALVTLVLAGRSAGALWVLTLTIPAASVGLVLLVLAGGAVLGSRLFDAAAPRGDVRPTTTHPLPVLPE